MSGQTTRVPLALLPVRLETHFVGAVLWIRVYPDVLHIDTHEPELTLHEEASGRSYWEQVWRAAGDHERQRRAWNTLVERHGARRSAWIARLLRPDPSQMPTEPIQDDDDLDPAPAFPDLAMRTASWTRAPIARALPTRWRAVGSLWAELDVAEEPPLDPPSDVRTVTGSRIPDYLPTGPDKAVAGRIPVWMTDFSQAEEVGMGLRLPLTPAMQTQGLHRLVVFGINEEMSPDQGARELADLLDAHYYTDGLAFVPPGTPTNNTESVSSGRDDRAAAHTEALRVAPTDNVPEDADTAAPRLATALGIPLTETATVPSATGPRGLDVHIEHLARTRWAQSGSAGSDIDHWLAAENELRRRQARALGAGADGADVQERTTRAMHSALWAGTLGYYMSQMLAEARGSDARRLDRHGMIAKIAYGYHLARIREAVEDWLAAQRWVIGVDETDPQWEPRRKKWIQRAAEYHRDVHGGKSWLLDPTPENYANAERDLRSTIAWVAKQNWRARGAPTGDHLSDWLAAERELAHYRAERFAYYHWQRRVELGDNYWGETLEDWRAGEVAAAYSLDTEQDARRHFVDYVRPGGSLPAIRVGSQPYGVLPVLPLEHWVPATGEESHRPVVHALRALRDHVWLQAAARMPQVGAHRRQTVEEGQDTLLHILATSPLNQAVFAREHLGHDYVANLWRFLQLQLRSDWVGTARWTSAAVLDAVGIAWSPRLIDLIAGEHSAPVPGPLIGDNAAEYLSWLADPSRRWTDLSARLETGGNAQETPLLYRLLRQSALRELVSAATRVQFRRRMLDDWEHIEPELIDLRIDRLTQTPARQLARTIWVAGAELTLEEYVAEPASAGDPDIEVNDFREAVTRLLSSDPERLEFTLREALDSLSHRLDAWLTSYATKRLQSQRETTPEGLVLGGYGWLEHLSPRDDTPVSNGFIHAPSLQQAVTAGILRSGYLSHTGAGRNPFAVNLSSERVRLARHILDSIRNGQTLPAVAGYLFERAIHDVGADHYLDDFRDFAPMRETVIDTAGGAPQEAVQPSAVVDGLALRTKWRNGDAALTTLLATIGDTARDGVEQALGRLDEAMDAVADMCVVESLHYAVSGNPTRSAATLDAIARGDGTVPDIEFVRTPRSGIALTHRIALVAEAESTPASGWRDDEEARLRRHISPALDAIVSAYLPHPDRVRCTVSFTTETRVGTSPVYLSQCSIGALDCVYANAPNTESPVSAILELAVSEEFRRRFGLTFQTPISIDWTPGADWSDEDLTFPDLWAATRLVRSVLRHGRPLRGSDIVVPEKAHLATDEFDNELATRSEEAAKALRAAAAQMAEPSSRSAGLRLAATLGVMGAAEALLYGTQDEGTIDAISAELTRRCAKLDAISPAATGRDPNESSRECIRTVLGEEFIPVHAVRSVDPSALVADLVHGDNLLAADPSAGRRWLQRVGKVHAGVGALERVRVAGAAYGPAAPLQFRVLQVPAVPSEPWIGEHANVAGPRLNTAMLTVPGIDASAPIAGLILQEWVEVVPSTVQTTGVAYHFDTPGAEAPQSILLGVAPDHAKSTWTLDMVEATVNDALRIAKTRMADPEALQDVGQLLPALYLPNNVGGHTAPTDFIPE